MAQFAPFISYGVTVLPKLHIYDSHREKKYLTHQNPESGNHTVFIRCKKAVLSGVRLLVCLLVMCSQWVPERKCFAPLAGLAFTQ